MRRGNWLPATFFLWGCAKVLSVQEIPQIALGEATFFPTIEAHTDAPIVAGNRVEVLLNGDETFPAMLRDVKSAKSTITFAQYLYEDGSIARDLAAAFAERCRAGVSAHILLDSHGSGNAPAEIISSMRDAGCKVEYFRRIEAQGIIFPWKLLARFQTRRVRSLRELVGMIVASIMLSRKGEKTNVPCNINLDGFVYLQRSDRRQNFFCL
jgi:cardiolipin synthase